MPPPADRHEPLHYPFGDARPDVGAAFDVADGVRWLRMRLPFALDHINLWLLRDRIDGVDGWTVVDCGIADAATRAAWESVFANALDGDPVLRVVVTHMHPDHLGLADWLCERWRCRLWISATDWNAARVASHAATGFGGAAAAAFFALHGLADAGALAWVRERTNYYAQMVPAVPRQYRRLIDGQRLDIGGRRWTCIAGYGHAPEHIALHAADGRLLISGDMVLPRISTNVSVVDLEPEADPLPLYLDSIAALARLPADTLVLPSHGLPFTGLRARVAQLDDHHAARCADVLAACADRTCSAADLLPVLFQRPLDAHQTAFAIGEAIAHLHLLAGRGEVRAEDGADGVRRWRTVAG